METIVTQPGPNVKRKVTCDRRDKRILMFNKYVVAPADKSLATNEGGYGDWQPRLEEKDKRDKWYWPTSSVPLRQKLCPKECLPLAKAR